MGRSAEPAPTGSSRCSIRGGRTAATTSGTSEKKEDLPEWQLAQEYPDNPEDAFLKSGRPVFSLEVLRKVAARSRDPIVEGYLAEHRQWQFVDEPAGP